MTSKKILLAVMMVVASSSTLQSASSQPTTLGQSSNPSVDIGSLLTDMSKSEVEQRRMSSQISVTLTYAIPHPQAKESRSFLTTPDQVLLGLSNAKKSLQLTRWFTNGVRFLNEDVHFLSTGEASDYNRSSYDGREYREFAIPPKEITKDLVPTEARGIGITGEGERGGLGPIFGSLLKQNKPTLVGKTVLNSIQAYQIKAEPSTSTGGAQYTVWLSPERSYREVRRDTESRIGLTEYKVYKSRQEVLKFVRFRDNWVPQKWVEVSWLINQQNKIVWNGLRYFELTQIKPLESEQRSIFSTDFPLGVFVSDNARNNSYIEGEDFMPFLKTLNASAFPKEIQDFVTRVVTEETAKNNTATTTPVPASKLQ